MRTVTDPAVTAMYGKRYVFAAIDQTELGLETRINLLLGPKMSLQAYIQPLISVGRYSGFKEAAQPRTYDFIRYGADGGTITFVPEAGVYRVAPAVGSDFVIPNPDFNFASLRANVVYRWEFKPGSTFYAVWTQQREDETTEGRFAFNRRHLAHDARARRQRVHGEAELLVQPLTNRLDVSTGLGCRAATAGQTRPGSGCGISNRNSAQAPSSDAASTRPPCRLTIRHAV